ncbi:MAG TPA: FAD-dependent oxidoreductase [Beijerinckiaceae bacterium]|nr:FAD-dependent oxidoreductase [Beijerinckiaceae bacterium]
MDDEKKELRDLSQWMAISLLAPGQLLGGRVGKERVLVWRDGDSFKAFSASCPHLEGPLDEGIVVDKTIRCPWHHACFDLTTGTSISAPAFDSLRIYEIELENGCFAVRSAAQSTGKRAALSGGNGSPDPMVIVGGGAAGFAAADTLRRRGWSGGIIMVSEEDAEPYDRTLLTKDYLDGHFGADRLPIARHSLDEIGIRFEPGTPVESVEPVGKTIHFKGGRSQRYAKLLLATGAAPRMLTVPGTNLSHVLALRSLADCHRLLARLQAHSRIVVVGGSFIALEAAASLRSRGLSVTVVAPESHPLEKVFGRELSDLIVDVHRQKGVNFHLGSKVARIERNAIILENGREIAADIVLIGIGVTPRIELAKGAGLKVGDGVCVNARLQSSQKDIFAAGDIAQWPDPRSGELIRVEHWVVAERQGEAAGANMLGLQIAFEMVPFFWTKHFDLAIRYVGHVGNWDEIQIEGDVSLRNAAIHFRKEGRDLAVATVGRDGQSLQVEASMEKERGNVSDATASGAT